MTKLLRKYNKWLLAGFGSFLLVTWLVSGSGSFGQDPRKRVVAKIGDRNIRAIDMLLAEQEYRSLKQFVPGVISLQLGVDGGPHWLLLSEQASRQGFTAESGDGAAWIKELAADEARFEVVGNPQYRGIAEYILSNPQMMANFTQTTEKKLTELHDANWRGELPTARDFDLALAKLRGVERFINAFQHAPRMSDVRLIREISKVSSRISFDAVVIPGERVPGIAEPTPEKLNELFEKYKAVKKGTGEYGFGYESPKRVKLEWMSIRKSDLNSALVLDPVEVNKYWLQNRDKFKGEFSAERTKVENELREKKIEATYAEIEQFVRNRVRSATRNLDASSGGKKLPADWESKRPKLDELAAAMVAQVSAMKLPLPRVEKRAADFTPIADLRTDPELGSVQFRVGTTSGSIEEFLAQTYELSDANNLGLQVGIPFDSALTNPAGDRFYITVLDAKKESPAENLDRVKTQVIADAKRLAGFEQLKAKANDFTERCLLEGLDALAHEFAAPGPDGKSVDLTVDKRVVVSKSQSDPANPQYDTQEFRDALVAKIEALGQTTKPVPENLVLRSLAVPLPGKLGLAVVQITGFEPLSAEMMRTAGSQVADGAANREIRSLVQDKPELNPFEFKSLKTSMAYIHLEQNESEGSKDRKKAK